jgi:hypothetical protein
MKALLGAIVFGLLFPFCAMAGEGFDAGYNWAERKGIDDPDDCYNRSGGYINNSRSFTEGCLAYVHEEAASNEDTERDSEDEDDNND